MSIALRLKQARVEAGLSQRRAAMEVKVEQSSIWRYEAGRRIPSATILRRLALAYGKSLDWFLEDGTDEEVGRTDEEVGRTDEEAGQDDILIAIRDRRREIYNKTLNALNSAGVVLSEEQKIAIATYAGYVVLIEDQEEGKPPSFS